MSIRTWLYGGGLITHTAPPTGYYAKAQPKEDRMDFATFTRTYKDKLKADKSPYTFPADTMLVAAQTGLSAEEINAYVEAWGLIQGIYVKNANRMPTVDEIIQEY